MFAATCRSFSKLLSIENVDEIIFYPRYSDSQDLASRDVSETCVSFNNCKDLLQSLGFHSINKINVMIVREFKSTSADSLRGMGGIQFDTCQLSNSSLRMFPEHSFFQHISVALPKDTIPAMFLFNYSEKYDLVNAYFSENFSLVESCTEIKRGTAFRDDMIYRFKGTSESF